MKKQVWIPQGFLIKPAKKSWSKTHCMLPTPIKISKNKYRIFYASRNKNNQSCITFSEIEFNKKIKVTKNANSISLTRGRQGCFDDNGVLPSSIIKKKNYFYMYYIGWQPRVTTRYSLIAGLSYSKNGKKFKRFQNFPILNNNDKENISILTAPYVLKVKNNYMMWYVSGIKWVNSNTPTYDIKLSLSKDGKNWFQTKQSCIKLKKGERAVARPFVQYNNKKFKMWYSYESKVGSYRIGYAESLDGIKWTRKDKIINFNKKEKSATAMREYSVVLNFKDETFLLYNGDNYGKQGILHAKLEKQD